MIAVLYTATCDASGCGALVRSYETKMDLRLVMQEHHWREVKGKVYCAKCSHEKKHLMGRPRSPELPTTPRS